MPKINQNCTTVKYEIFIQGDVSIILRVFRFTDLIPRILGFKDLIGTPFFVQPVNLKTLQANQGPPTPTSPSSKPSRAKIPQLPAHIFPRHTLFSRTISVTVIGTPIFREKVNYRIIGTHFKRIKGTRIWALIDTPPVPQNHRNFFPYFYC